MARAEGQRARTSSHPPTRARLHSGMLPSGREAQLDALGIDWQPCRSENERTWDQRMTELLAFQTEFGHCLVRGQSTSLTSPLTCHGSMI